MPLLHNADPSVVLEAVRGLDRTKAIEFVSSFIHRAPPAAAVARPQTVTEYGGGASVFSDFANFGFMPLTSPKAQLAPVEARDEYEQVLKMAQRLPSLRTSVTP